MQLGATREAAIKAIVAQDPTLHQQYLVAYNERYGRPVHGRGE
jgi:hypothetical protein